ncbi:Acetyltransferase (GNAT) family protein [Pseudarcicella hirudinis]|uniref:Acetyltransferase (GNAT) family protein n=1 Tax=Pseudarcicella hirudinis TaxID=1079859 RepID=A0A1I5YR88_9BACT|nr:GNAT family N-acetyltransferase [Pseudarcicella hirudinis]SFQ46741.1 Acetyltransferase (GNAT) family protein [Pseudarcicella hirudinis]
MMISEQYDSLSPVLRMRKHLKEIIFVAQLLPDEVRKKDFNDDLIGEAHELLTLSYQNGEGNVASLEDWWNTLRLDEEFDPALCFVLYDDEGIVGFAQCWTSSFIKDIVIHPRRRREGLAEVLLWTVFSEFQKRGAQYVDLKVLHNNYPAIQLYRKAGMEVIGIVPDNDIL